MIKKLLISISLISTTAASKVCIADPDFTSIPLPDPNVCSVAKVTARSITGFSDSCCILKLSPERVNALTAQTSKDEIISEITSIFSVAAFVNTYELLADMLENRLNVLKLWYARWIAHWDRLKDVNENAKLKLFELVTEREKLSELMGIFSNYKTLFTGEEPSKLSLLGSAIMNGYKDVFESSIHNLSGDIVPALPVNVQPVEVVMPQLPEEDLELPAALKEPLMNVTRLTSEKMAQYLDDSKQLSNRLMLAQLELSAQCHQILSFGIKALESTEHSWVLHQLFWNRITMLQTMFANLVLNASDLTPEHLAEAKYYYDRLYHFRQLAKEDEMKYFHPIVIHKDIVSFSVTHKLGSAETRLNYNEQLCLLYESVWFRPNP